MFDNEKKIKDIVWENKNKIPKVVSELTKVVHRISDSAELTPAMKRARINAKREYRLAMLEEQMKKIQFYSKLEKVEK